MYTASFCARAAISRKEQRASSVKEGGIARRRSTPMFTAGGAEGASEAMTAECPVCMEPYAASGARTKVYAFSCVGGISHAICSACDRTLYVRQEDRCPICRAGRSHNSLQRNGPRPMQLPPPITDYGFGFRGTDSGTLHPHPNGGFVTISNILSWLPRRVGANGQRTVDGSRPSRVFVTRHEFATHGRGNQVFYPMDTVEDSDLNGGFVSAYQIAAADRRQRAQPATAGGTGDVLSDDDDSVAPPPASRLPREDTRHDAALAVLLGRDEGIGAALDGLTDLTASSVVDFAQRVHGARWTARRSGLRHARDV